MDSSPNLNINNQTFEHVGDLEWFEGALLSLFLKPSNGVLHILHWIDVQEGCNQWLFFPVSPRALRLYLEGKLSNQDLFFLDPSPNVKMLHINGDFMLHKALEVEKNTLPEDSRPSKDGYFQKELCPDMEVILDVLKNYSLEAGRYEYVMAA